MALSKGWVQFKFPDIMSICSFDAPQYVPVGLTPMRAGGVAMVMLTPLNGVLRVMLDCDEAFSSKSRASIEYV